MLRNSGLRSGIVKAWRQDANPMESVANLVDVMLVFACGLMIAILLHWNVDLRQEVVSSEDLVEIGSFQEAVENGVLTDDLDSRGVAYEDPETGKIYIVMP